jgi:hypothetical protein
MLGPRRAAQRWRQTRSGGVRSGAGSHGSGCQPDPRVPHQGGLTVALRGLLLAAPREPVEEESGEKQAENRERYGGRNAFG